MSPLDERRIFIPTCAPLSRLLEVPAFACGREVEMRLANVNADAR